MANPITQNRNGDNAVRAEQLTLVDNEAAEEPFLMQKPQTLQTGPEGLATECQVLILSKASCAAKETVLDQAQKALETEKLTASPPVKAEQEHHQQCHIEALNRTSM